MSTRMQIAAFCVSIFIFVLLFVGVCLIEFNLPPSYKHEVEENISGVLSGELVGAPSITLNINGADVTYHCNRLKYISVVFNRNTGAFSWNIRSDLDVVRISLAITLFIATLLSLLIITILIHIMRHKK